MYTFGAAPLDELGESPVSPTTACTFFLTVLFPIPHCQIDADVGKGVVAQTPIAGGAAVWEETPLVAIQHVYNKVQSNVRKWVLGLF